MKGICLCSGGLDSTLVLLKLLKDGNTVTPVFIDYNQWSLEGELLAYHSILSWATKYFKKKSWVDLYPRYIKVDWHDPAVSERGPGVGSVWGRSIALVGLAAMWAYTHGDDYDFITLGLHKGDVGPDCKPGGLFESHLDYVLRDATKSKIKLCLPIKELTVEDIGRELAEFGIPWNLMYSCYWENPCGYRSPNDSYRCPGCRRKVIAMRAGGVKPEELLLPNCKERTYQSPLSESPGY